MKRIIIGLVVALLATVTVTATAVATPKPGKKVTICHFTGKKYVAITVSKKAAATHVAHHQDVVTGVPAGSKAAKAFCAALPVLTATKGGKLVEGNLTSTTANLTGNLGLRLRLGQGDLCFKLTVTAPTAGSTITVSTVTLQGAGTPVITLTLPATKSGTSPLTLSGCMPLDRTLVKQLLQNASDFTITVSTSAGTLTGKLG